MGIELIAWVVIVSPVVFGLAVLRWVPTEWLCGFEILARSLGRPM